MPAPYTVFLASDAAQFLRSLRRAERDAIRRFLDLLEDYPTTEGETQERDVVGRDVQVKLLGRIKLVYWADHAVKEIKVLHIEGLRRRIR